MQRKLIASHSKKLSNKKHQIPGKQAPFYLNYLRLNEATGWHLHLRLARKLEVLSRTLVTTVVINLGYRDYQCYG